jgi:hypothetical protein
MAWHEAQIQSTRLHCGRSLRALLGLSADAPVGTCHDARQIPDLPQMREGEGGMSCPICASPIAQMCRFNYWCLGCCIRVLMKSPRVFREGHLMVIERICGPDHAAEVKAKFVEAWEVKKK